MKGSIEIFVMVYSMGMFEGILLLLLFSASADDPREIGFHVRNNIINYKKYIYESIACKNLIVYEVIMLISVVINILILPVYAMVINAVIALFLIMTICFIISGAISLIFSSFNIPQDDIRIQQADILQNNIPVAVVIVEPIEVEVDVEAN